MVLSFTSGVYSEVMYLDHHMVFVFLVSQRTATLIVQIHIPTIIHGSFLHLTPASLGTLVCLHCHIIILNRCYEISILY